MAKAPIPQPGKFRSFLSGHLGGTIMSIVLWELLSPLIGGAISSVLGRGEQPQDNLSGWPMDAQNMEPPGFAQGPVQDPFTAALSQTVATNAFTGSSPFQALRSMQNLDNVYRGA